MRSRRHVRRCAANYSSAWMRMWPVARAISSGWRPSGVVADVARCDGMSSRHDAIRACVAEALGTAMLLAAVVGSGIMAERLAGATSPSRSSQTRSPLALRSSRSS